MPAASSARYRAGRIAAILPSVGDDYCGTALGRRICGERAERIFEIGRTRRADFASFRTLQRRDRVADRSGVIFRAEQHRGIAAAQLELIADEISPPCAHRGRDTRRCIDGHGARRAFGAHNFFRTRQREHEQRQRQRTHQRRDDSGKPAQTDQRPKQHDERNREQVKRLGTREGDRVQNRDDVPHVHVLCLERVASAAVEQHRFQSQQREYRREDIGRQRRFLIKRFGRRPVLRGFDFQRRHVLEIGGCQIREIDRAQSLARCRDRSICRFPARRHRRTTCRISRGPPFPRATPRRARRPAPATARRCDSRRELAPTPAR